MSHHHTHSPGPLADASVRTARTSDTPAIGLVQAVVWQEAYAGVLPAEVLAALEAPHFAAAWREALQSPPSPAHRVLVACAGDQVVGLVAIGPAPAHEQALPERCGEVLELSVHPQARRQGHGSRLLNAAGDTLRAHDLGTLSCWVRAGDEATRAFLSTGGLEPDGAWRERVVGPDGGTVREIRVLAGL